MTKIHSASTSLVKLAARWNAVLCVALALSRRVLQGAQMRGPMSAPQARALALWCRASAVQMAIKFANCDREDSAADEAVIRRLRGFAGSFLVLACLLDDAAERLEGEIGTPYQRDVNPLARQAMCDAMPVTAPLHADAGKPALGPTGFLDSG